MSKKPEHGKKPSPWKVVKGVASEMFQGKKKERQHSDPVDGKTKYTVLCCLLVRLGSQVLRDVFDRVIHPQDLWSTLKREPVHSELRSLRKEGILNPAQWIQLYPVKPSSVSSTGFDNSLLLVLLRTICNLSPPATGWDLLPHSSDNSCESHIVRLKYCVNAVSAHTKEASVSDGEFCKYRKQIQEMLVGLGGAEYEDAIHKMEEEEMDSWDEEHFKELLKQWKDNDNRIKDKLNEWECKMKTSRDADCVQPEASCADVVSEAAATGSSTHTHHEQGAVDGKTKYTLLCCLLVRLGSQVLRDVFDGLIYPQDLCSALQREPVHSKLLSLRKEGILSQEQWSKLYPVECSSVSSTGFDNSLLIVLLRTICNLNPPATGWDLLPHSSDNSCESHIVRLKYCVNAVSAHTKEASVSDGEFWKFRKQIHKTLVRLGGAEFKDAICKVEKEEMDPFDDRHFKELLKQWKDSDNRIKDKLNKWECKMKTSGDADCVQPEAGCGDVVSAAAATGSSTHTHHEQDPVHPEASCAGVLSAAAGSSTHSQHDQELPHSANIIERVRQLYSTREKSIFPVPWLDDFSFHLDDVFTMLKILGKEKTRGTLTDEITNMTAIFRGHKDCAKPRTVLIEGDPGMGKTTYCQKLAYDWAMKREEWDKSFPGIDVLLLLRCRDIKTDIWEAIDDQILPLDIDKEDKEWFFKFIRENQSKVLLVLDGLDEVDSSKVGMYNDLLESKMLPNCHIVITSRHETGKSVRRYCDTLWEIVGFTLQDAKSYIRKYFKGMEHLANRLLKQLDFHIFSNGDLRQLTRNPLNTALLCILIEDFKGVLPPERTQLYTEIVRCVLLRYEKRNRSSTGSDADLLEIYKDDLVELGCMALQSLRKGELFFDENEFKGSSSNLIKFGFLSIQTGGSKRKPSSRFCFLHKTFQEFFAGYYLAYQILDGDTDCKSVVTDVKDRKKLKQVFLFMSGILSTRSEEMTVSLVKGIAELASSSNMGMQNSKKEILEFAFDCILECKCHGENLQSKLLQTFGQNFLVKDLAVRIRFDHVNLFCEIVKVNTCVTTLNLRDNEISFAVAESLSEALKVNTCLTTLDLEWNGIGSAGAEYLSEALKVNTCLTTLKLNSNKIDAAGSESLSEALKVNTCLTTLDLRGNQVGSAGAESLSEALKVNTCLTTLDLRGNQVGSAGAEFLSDALKVNTCLTTLKLTWNKIGAAGAESLSEALKVNTCLTTLDLCANQVGSAGAESLSEALKVNTCLTTLDLEYNGIGSAGAESLSEALKVNTFLTTLDLRNNKIGSAGAESLSEALKVNTCLTTLDLRNNEIGSAGAECLSEALKVNTCLTTLDLSYNVIDAAGAESLSEALKVNTCLTTLKLNSNKIDAADSESLSEALKVNTCLTTLELRGNQVGSAGAESLSEALKVNTYLTTLDLRGNQVGSAGTEFLSEALKVNTCLTTLKLTWNKIGAAGAESLSEALKVNTCLTTLDLCANQVGSAGAESLSEALKVNTCLTTLDLEYNGIGSAGAESLSEALKVNTCLTTLHLRNNEIGSAGAECLSEALKVNTCLTTLHLRNNEIGSAGAECLSEALKVNTCLTTLDLSDNVIDAAGAESLS
ncbi:protein NLRC3-like isoform X2 [Montipora capricornis]|uniref:protein NLRC3-like isoform X2 n=1 Tax=Montipora capricornis TaxID=246305 RepID=UPI0035F14EE7